MITEKRNMKIADENLLAQIEEMAQKRKMEILNAPDSIEISGTAYYVSNDGNDDNDGKSPETAWKTLQKVSEAELCEGDGVRFRRGDVFRGVIFAQACVTYCAYGEGEKPKFYGWDKSLADASLWTLYDKEHNIWKLNEKILDCGTIVFNDGESHSRKLIPSYIGGRFVCRDNESLEFDMARDMTEDLDIVCFYTERLVTKIPHSTEQGIPVPRMDAESFGELYLRCDKGNPAEVFESVEALPGRTLFRVGKNDNVKIDNLCIKYVGAHAIQGSTSVNGLRVTNCETGWIGGTIQNYYGVDPNYPEGPRGSVTRYGNGIEIYGACDDYEVSDCYVYQIYDAAMTHQVDTRGKFLKMTNVRYLNNLIEYCVYSIEYFLIKSGGDTESYMDGIEMSGNILRFAGYGWGQQRHNTHTPAHIKGWSFENTASNYYVHDNIFDRSAYRMLHLVAKKNESCPVMKNNTYIQHKGMMIGQYGGNETKEPPILLFDENAEQTICNVFGDTNAKIYCIL